MSVELDRHGPQHVPPSGLVHEDLLQLCLSGFAGQEEIKRLIETLRTREGVQLHQPDYRSEFLRFGLTEGDPARRLWITLRLVPR